MFKRSYPFGKYKYISNTRRVNTNWAIYRKKGEKHYSMENMPIRLRVAISKTNGIMIKLDITMKHEQQLRGSKQETTKTECMKLKGRNRNGGRPLGQGIYMMHRVL